jgi:hypothetical protein
MALLSKKQIIESDDLKSEIVAVPEWGGDVKVRVMTGTERDAFEASIFDSKGKDSKVNLKNLRAKLIVLTVISDTGEKLFTDADVETLGGKSAKALDRVFAVAQKINGIGQKEVEELTKN